MQLSSAAEVKGQSCEHVYIMYSVYIQYLSMVDENVEERVEQEYSVSCDTGRVQQDRLERE